MLLLSADFYILKNIAGRRLVGLRWWNEVDPTSGEGTMVFESLDPRDPDCRRCVHAQTRSDWAEGMDEGEANEGTQDKRNRQTLLLARAVCSAHRLGHLWNSGYRVY